MALEVPAWAYKKRRRWLRGGLTPDTITDFAGAAYDNGSIALTWTFPPDSTEVFINYSVDQTAAPSAPELGIPLGYYSTSVAIFTGCTYGASYKFSIWGYKGGQYSAAADTVTVVGPLVPSVYGTLKLWVDARREDAYVDGGTVQTPQDFASGGFGLTQGTAGNRPIWRNAANGINGMPAFRFAVDADTTARCWTAAQTTPTIDTAGAGNGFSVAAIAATEGDTAADKGLIAHWANSGSGFRRWRLYQSTGANVFTLGLSTDGNNQTGAVTFTGLSGTGPYSMVGTYVQGTGAYTFKNGDGLDDTDLTVGTALAAANTTACLRVGNGRAATSDPYYGKATIILGYSAPLSQTAAEILDADLASLAGT